MHSNLGDRVLDFFAGSGSFGEAAARHGRAFVLVDNHPVAVRIMRKRLAEYAPEVEWRGDLAEAEAFESAGSAEPAEAPAPPPEKTAPPSRPGSPGSRRRPARAPRATEPNPQPTRGGRP